ncbi:hypothetical protein [Streptomyces sp. NPDC001665]
MPFTLPDGLPVGRFHRSGNGEVWISDAFPPDIARLWRRLADRRETPNLVPLLCRPDAIGTPLCLERAAWSF